MVVFSGPSGVGKTTIMKALRKRFHHAKMLISETTRSIRPGEKAGEQYNFITKEQFEAGIAQEKYLEWALVHQKNYYGILKSAFEEGVRNGDLMLREVDMQGLKNLRQIIPAEFLVSIFIEPENLPVLLDRIHKRGDLPAEELQRRMESARREMADKDLADYRVPSYEGKLQDCVQSVVEIVNAESRKRTQQN